MQEGARRRPDDEIELLMEEYSQELMNTEPGKKIPKRRARSCCRYWVKEFGNEKGEIMLHSADGLRYLRRTPATKAGSACTSF